MFARLPGGSLSQVPLPGSGGLCVKNEVATRFCWIVLSSVHGFIRLLFVMPSLHRMVVTSDECKKSDFRRVNRRERITRDASMPYLVARRC